MLFRRTKIQKDACLYKILFLVLFYLSSSNGFFRKVNATQADNERNDFRTHGNVDVLNMRPHDEFSTYTIIKPAIYNGDNNSLLRNTLDQARGQHFPNILLTYNHGGYPVQIDLKLNEKLLPNQHFLRYQNIKSNSKSNSSQSYALKNFTKTENELCHYQGSIRGKPNSRAAVSTCNGVINGIVIDSSDAYIIHAESDEILKSQHFLFRASHLRNKNTSCGHEGEEEIFMSTSNRFKRSIDDINLLHGPYKSNKDSLYVELVIVADNSVYRFFESHMGKVHQYCKDVANVMSALYAPLNVFVILTGVVVWNERDEIEMSPESRETLHNFLEYRSRKLSLEYPNDHAQLLTKTHFNDNIVGKAFVGPMCMHEKSGAVCMVHSPIVAVVANTMAHEMGHTFGMAHDTSGCKCADKKCIMSDTSSSYIPTQWSSCSIESLTYALSRGLRYCLQNKPKKFLSSSICGNGFVEPGEECDCGLPEFCRSNCCNPRTCRLNLNATCGSGECCDLKSCRLKKAGKTCRNANSECDLTEYCDGISEYCPKDVYKHDAAECANGAGYCYEGQCGSHEQQCRILWGSAAVNMEHCYPVVNKRGDRSGNCGFNILTNETIKCQDEHVKCGKLQCNYPKNRKDFGIANGVETWSSYALYNRKYIECRSALFDFGLHTPDPGMTPNGAKCGDKKMCLEQKCIAIDELLVKECPENCNGNGICNSEGHCHCDIGFAGSTCRAPGPGGSSDSGPATNPSSHDTFKRFMYIFFGGVIPFAILFYIFINFYRKSQFCKRKNILQNDISTISEILYPTSTTKALLGPSLNNIRVDKDQNHQRKATKSTENIIERKTETPATSLNSVDESSLPKVQGSVKSLVKNFENSCALKSASNYELSTLSSSTKTLPCPERKVITPVIVKKSYKSASTLAGTAVNRQNIPLKPKIEITDIRLQSSTNPLVAALGSQVALMGNSTSDSHLDKSKINFGYSEGSLT